MITDIKYSKDGYLHGKLFGYIDIHGTDLKGLKVAAKEALENYSNSLLEKGKSLEDGLLEMIDDLYTRK